MQWQKNVHIDVFMNVHIPSLKQLYDTLAKDRSWRVLEVSLLIQAHVTHTYINTWRVVEYERGGQIDRGWRLCVSNVSTSLTSVTHQTIFGITHALIASITHQTIIGLLVHLLEVIYTLGVTPLKRVRLDVSIWETHQHTCPTLHAVTHKQ